MPINKLTYNQYKTSGFANIQDNFEPMIIVMKSGSSAAEIERVSEEIRRWNITP